MEKGIRRKKGNICLLSLLFLAIFIKNIKYTIKPVAVDAIKWVSTVMLFYFIKFLKNEMIYCDFNAFIITL
ncbi:MAG TPA: hypothetical protein PKD00_03085 [Burkholderiales bacterium]|nr:hypothetical protein [Burkholderiales bacterium]